MLELIKKNRAYIIWFVIYFTIAWLMFGFSKEGFLILVVTYAISISFALSPLGERLLRFIEGLRRPQTKIEKEYLFPIFEEVYENARKEFPKLKSNIELFITDDMYLNAFAIGKSTIALTKGSIETFSEEELKGVIAHELGHIAHGDTKALLLNVIGNGIFTIIILVNKIVMLILELIGRIFASLSFVALIAWISRQVFDLIIFLIGFIGQIILSMNGRYSEKLADEFGYKIGFGQELIDALYLLQKASIPPKLSITDRLRATHPNLGERIERLENMMEATEA